MKMTIADLIERLSDYPEDAEVMLMYQPSWPLREVVGGIVSEGEIARMHKQDEDEEFEAMIEDMDPDERFEAWKEREEVLAAEEAAAEKVVYILAGGHPYNGSPYGDKAAWEEIGW